MATTVRDVIEGRGTWAVMLGDCLASLRALPDRCVHMACTSPPYYALRDYGTGKWEGGDPACKHTRPRNNGRVTPESKVGSDAVNVVTTRQCHCGAVRVDEQVGLEDSPGEYIERLVGAFRELRRVLRDDGTFWLNVGDTYANDIKGPNSKPGPGLQGSANSALPPKVWHAESIKKKDRMMIPARLALALQADGWWLRDEIVWYKPNPMTLSVRDRTTPAHEMLYLLTKKPRYYYDAEAVCEAAKSAGKPMPRASGWAAGPGSHSAVAHNGRGGYAKTADVVGATRNRRSVWRVSSRRYKGAHFATFPEKLIEPCILAGTSAKGVCPTCGAPWVRIVKRERKPTRPGKDVKYLPKSDGDRATAETMGWNRPQVIGNRDPQRHCTVTETVGWEGGCACAAGSPTPAIVLDPFAGSGTTLAVAVSHGRRAIGCELNPEYLTLIAQRMANVTPNLFSEGM